MNDVTTTPDMADDVLPDEITSRLSIFEKTTPELRRKLDKAILDYEPAGYRPLFKKYNLADHGVSFTAFYRYARKLRARAATLQLAAEVLPAEGPSLVELLPDLISQFLVEQIIANDQIGPDAIYKLTLAHRAALENAAMVRKHKAAREAADARARIPPALDVAVQCQGSRTPTGGNPFPQTDQSLNDLPMDELLARATTALAAGNARLAEGNAQLAAESAAIEAQGAAELEEAKKTFCAMGYPVADVKTADELCEIVDHYDPTAAPVAAAGARIPSRTPNGGNPFPRITPTTPAPREISDAAGVDKPPLASPPLTLQSDVKGSRSEISNPQISTPLSDPGPPPPKKLPLINQDFPDPDPQREKLRRQVRAAYKLPIDPPSKSDLLESLIDPALPEADPSTPDGDLSPAQRRQRDLRRVLLDYGLIKDPAPDSS